MDYNTFAEQIKSKYPQYKDVDNLTLSKSIIQKYPTYANQVVLPKKQTYKERVQQKYTEAGQDIISNIKTGATSLEQARNEGGIAGRIKQALASSRVGLRTAGAVASASFAPITEAPGIKQGLEKSGELISKIPGVEDIISKALEVSKKYPEASKDIQSIVDIATLGGGSAVEKPLGTGISKATSKAKLAITPSEEAVKKNIEDLFQKAVKPTAKKTTQQGKQYRNNIINAFRSIRQNADSLNIEDASGEIILGTTPKTIRELEQAVEQTKKTVFDSYDSLARQAGNSGVVVETNKIVDELRTVGSNKALQISNPEVIDYANKIADRFEQFGTIDAQTTQEVIKNYNNNLSAFYRNPSYETASKVAVDAGVVNNLRKVLDEKIEGATGKGYQALKNQYSALKAIENDVVRAANREARKNAKGLLDYTDIFTGGQMVSGILSLNPAMFAKGAAERGLKEYIKFINDPNRAIEKIFKQLEVKTK